MGKKRYPKQKGLLIKSRCTGNEVIDRPKCGTWCNCPAGVSPSCSIRMAGDGGFLWVGMVQFHGQTQLFNLFQCQNGRRVVHGPQIPNDQMENRTRTRPWPHLTNARWPGSLCFSVFSAFFFSFPTWPKGVGRIRDSDCMSASVAFLLGCFWDVLASKCS